MISSTPGCRACLSDIKNSLISDDASLVKVISYCTSRGIAATLKSLTKTRTVKGESLGEFIDVDEAYQRIEQFVGTSQFFQLPKDDQMNAVAFILISERTESALTGPMRDNGIAEDIVLKKLE